MKPNSSSLATMVKRGGSPQWRRGNVGRWPSEGTGQPDLNIPRLVVRQPGLAGQRAYLKALREAEMAAWEGAQPVSSANATPKPARVRLPSPQPNVAEDRIYFVLTALCVLTLGLVLWDVLPSSGNWSDFVEFVRRLLA